MEFDSVRQLSAWLADTDIDVLELSGPGLRLRLRKDGAVEADDCAPRAAAAPAEMPAQPPPLTVCAPSVGVFLNAHPLQTTALATRGARVRAGETVGLLRIGSLLLPVSAPRDATVGSSRVAPGTPVGFGMPLLELGPL